MDIYSLFESVRSNETSQRELTFSYDGKLQDYLASGDCNEEIKNLFSGLEINLENLGITVDLKMDIRWNVTSQIIHYKDAFKISNPALTIPFLLYGKRKDGKDFGILLMPNIQQGYLYAKALYYCMTEKEGIFDQTMNQTLALYLDVEHLDEVKQSIKDVVEGEQSLGWIQRYYDRIYIGRMDDLKRCCIQESKRVFDEAEKLLESDDEREPIIHNAIAKCYLLKKCMYVHYMKCKNLLAARFNGDIHQLRSAAKKASDEIPFVSYADLWRHKEIEANAPILEQTDVYEGLENIEHAETPEEFARRVLGIDE